MSRRIGQIALCVSNHQRSTEFYSQIFGMDHIFGTNSFRGKMAQTVQGMKNAASVTQWLIDDRKKFQLEIFEFEHPQSRLLDSSFGVTNIGYNRVIIAVKSLAQTTNRASEAGCSTHAMDAGSQAASPLHAWLKDPDGVLLELIELPEHIKGNRPAQIVGVGLGSENADVTVRDMREGFGFSLRDDIFETEKYWPENDRLEHCQSLQLDDMFVVVSQYRDCSPRSPDYRLCDIGIMNFAIFFSDTEDLMRCYHDTTKLGMKANCEPIFISDKGAVTYNNSTQGFSVEMIYMVKKMWGLFGFSPPSLVDRIINYVSEVKARYVYPHHVRKHSK